MLFWLKIIFAAVFMIAGISWIIYNFVKMRKLVIDELCKIEERFSVTCMTCNETFEVQPKDFLKVSNLIIQKDKYVRKGFVGYNNPTSLQRWCPCPKCGCDKIVKFNDVERLVAVQNEIAKPIIIKYALIAFIPVLLIGKIITKF